MKSGIIRSSLPALLTIVLCLLVQAVQQALTIGAPSTFHFVLGRFETHLVLNLGLILSLPFIGATGAAFARHLGERETYAMRAVLSPIALTSAMLLCLLTIDLSTSHALVSSLAYSSGILIGWVIIPSTALLLGGFAGWTFPSLMQRTS
jgi:hypothetical protein